MYTFLTLSKSIYMIKEGKRVANLFFAHTIPASSESKVFLNSCFAHITMPNAVNLKFSLTMLGEGRQFYSLE